LRPSVDREVHIKENWHNGSSLMIPQALVDRMAATFTKTDGDLARCPNDVQFGEFMSEGACSRK